MDVAVWLRGLGLQQYEALFRENDVDAEVLSDLTDGDLEKIGVSLGHRKRLLKAVAALAGPAAAPPAAATPIPPVADAAERRQLTVLRPRGLDRAVGRARSRGYASGHSHLSGRLLGSDCALPRLVEKAFPIDIWHVAGDQNGSS